MGFVVVLPSALRAAHLVVNIFHVIFINAKKSPSLLVILKPLECLGNPLAV